MKTIKYIPNEAQGSDPKFEGYIELELIPYEQKLAYLEEFGYFDEEGGKKSNMIFLIKLLKAAKKHYVAVCLKNLKTGAMYSSYDDLSYDAYCHDLLQEVAGVVLNGNKVGNA